MLEGFKKVGVRGTVVRSIIGAACRKNIASLAKDVNIRQFSRTAPDPTPPAH